MLSKTLLFLFLSAIFLMNSFGLVENLYPLRLVLPLALIYFSLSLFQQVYLLKQKVEIQPLLFFSILFFVYMFFHTYIVTFVNYQFFNFDYELNSILNYTFLFALIVSLFVSFLSFPKQFFKKINSIVLLFYLLYSLFAVYEILTGNHLPTSTLHDASFWLQNSPTVVYHNSNDFASIFTLMLIYLFYIYDKDRSLSTLSLVMIFLLHFFIVYYSNSRISILLSFLFFVGRYPKQIISISFISCLLIYIIGNTFEPFWYVNILDDLAQLQTDLSFAERESTLVRLSLYKYSILSIFSNYGLGYGVDFSPQYFSSICDPALSYIINPHSYIFEILINSGLISFVAYIVLNLYLLRLIYISRDKDLFIQVVVYNFLLFSSSSSLFLWSHYLFFIIYICRASIYQKTT
jgi:teichuronic acid biosynthesis protein TuaE